MNKSMIRYILGYILAMQSALMLLPVVVAAIYRKRLSPFPGQIAATVTEVSPDAVVVTGDTICSRQARRFP